LLQVQAFEELYDRKADAEHGGGLTAGLGDRLPTAAPTLTPPTTAPAQPSAAAQRKMAC